MCVLTEHPLVYTQSLCVLSRFNCVKLEEMFYLTFVYFWDNDKLVQEHQMLHKIYNLIIILAHELCNLYTMFIS